MKWLSVRAFTNLFSVLMHFMPFLSKVLIGTNLITNYCPSCFIFIFTNVNERNVAFVPNNFIYIKLFVQNICVQCLRMSFLCFIACCKASTDPLLLFIQVVFYCYGCVFSVYGCISCLSLCFPEIINKTKKFIKNQES